MFEPDKQNIPRSKNGDPPPISPKAPKDFVDLQEAVLGAIIDNPVEAEQALNILSAEYFRTPKCKAVYQVISQIIKDEKLPDLTTVGEYSRGKNIDFSWLAGLTGKTPFNRLAIQHAYSLKEAYVRFTKIEFHQKAIADLKRGNSDTEIIQELNDLDSHDSQKEQASLQLISGLDIQPESIDWLWAGYLAKKKLHVFAGLPGSGKTTIAMSIGAIITSGGKFPDNTQAKSGNIIVWSGEDDPRDTLVPRLLAGGANLENVYFVGDVNSNGEITTFDPAKHIILLSQAVDRIGSVSLLIIDPIVNAVSGDSHKNTEVRRSLQPLVELANKTGIAIIGISHFSKGTSGRNPVERVTGSIAFGALARVVFAAAKVENSDGDEKRIFTRAKSNIGPDGGGFYYGIQQIALQEPAGIFTSKIDWLEPIEGDARSLLNDAETSDTEETSSLSEAKDWLESLLIDEGPLEKREVIELGKKNNLAPRTIQRAAQKLKVSSQVRGFGKGKTSIWSLNEPETPNPAYQPDSENMNQLHGTNDANVKAIENKEIKQSSLFNHANRASNSGYGTNSKNKHSCHTPNLGTNGTIDGKAHEVSL